MLRLNNKGFSQVSLFIGVIFLAIIVAIVMRTIQKQADNLNNIIAESEIITYTNKIKQYLSSPTNCTTTFQGVSTSNGKVDSIKVIKDGLKSKRYEIYSKSKKTVGSQALKIEEYSLNDYSVEDDEDLGEFGLVNLQIKIIKNINNAKKYSTQIIRLYMTTVNDRIETCAFGGLPSNTSIIQDKSNYIFLNTESLSVNGQDTRAMLNIKGTLNLSSDNDECTDFLKGALRYNKELKQFEACLNPPSWDKVHK
jgi:hypothetical protein